MLPLEDESTSCRRGVGALALVAALLLCVAAVSAAATAEGRQAQLARAFREGNGAAIAGTVKPGGKLYVEMPQFAEQSGFFGRDQAELLLRRLFAGRRTESIDIKDSPGTATPAGRSLRAAWVVIEDDGRRQRADVFLTLAADGENWYLTEIRVPRS